MNIKIKNNKFIILVMVAILGIGLFSSGYIKAKAQENLENKVSIVSKNSNGQAGIFNDKDGFWYPGRTLSKDFAIKNSFDKEIEFNKISVNIKSVSSFLLNRILNPDEEIYKNFLNNLKVQLKDGNTLLFDGSFEDFNSKGVQLKTPIKIAPNSEKSLSLSLHLEEETGNIFQDLQHLFNLSIQYVMDDGTLIQDNVTNLPKTGGVLNLITVICIGLLLCGIGTIFIAFSGKRVTFLKREGTKIEK